MNAEPQNTTQGDETLDSYLHDTDFSDIEKSWYQSKTILAAIAAMLPPLAHLAGIDYAKLAPYSGDIITVLAAVIAIYGRRTAVTIIK